MPYVEGSESIARWLAQDINAGQAISLGTTPWKPNERIIGLYRAVADDSERAGWHLDYETLTSTQKAMPLHGTHRVGGVRPIKRPQEYRHRPERTKRARTTDSSHRVCDVGARD